jgi:hypothetical protein
VSSRRSAWAYQSPGRDAHLRIGDAERTETADRLSKHFGDGRLDEAEFHERLDQAMHAKTRADLDALFHDLPPEGATPVPTARRRRSHSLLFLVLVAIAAIVTTSYVVSHIPWLLAGLVIFLLIRHRHARHHQS